MNVVFPPSIIAVCEEQYQKQTNCYKVPIHEKNWFDIRFPWNQSQRISNLFFFLLDSTSVSFKLTCLLVPVLVETTMTNLQIEWNDSGSVLAVSGLLKKDSKQLPAIHFYTAYGKVQQELE